MAKDTTAILLTGATNELLEVQDLDHVGLVFNLAVLVEATVDTERVHELHLGVHHFVDVEGLVMDHKLFLDFHHLG